MKTIKYTLGATMAVLTFAVVSCNCDEKKVPERTAATFSEMYPNAQNIKWNMIY